jgi:hypothetical protein
VVALNKGAAKLADAWSTDVARCFRSAASGRTDLFGTPETAQSCLTNDVTGRVHVALNKLIALEHASCLSEPEQLPVYAYENANAISGGVRTQSLGLISDLFGDDLDAAIVTRLVDKRGASCQSQLQKSAASVFKSSMQAVIACKTGALSGKARLAGEGPVGSLMELRDEVLACLDMSAHGSSGRIRKAVAKSRAAVLSKCAGNGLTTPLSDIAPGCAATDLEAFVSCPERVGACRFCGAANTTDGLGINCDLYDDGISNLSCS